MRRPLKQAIISTASAFGIKSADRRWLAALVGLRGTFERTGSDLAINIAFLVLLGGIVVTFAGLGIREYHQHGWTQGTVFLSSYCLCMACLLYFLVSRVGLRYMFGGGTVSAYNTWGRLLWSEDLTGIVDAAFFFSRGSTSVTLFWPDRKRALVFFNSLKAALGASTESADTTLEGSHGEVGATQTNPDGGAGPSWVCPGCHEENPESFNECWKCQRMRSPTADDAKAGIS
jgi:hypothetical protein